MAICETCGTTYTPKPEALDCPRCASQPESAPAQPQAAQPPRPVRARPAAPASESGSAAASGASASGVRRAAASAGAATPGSAARKAAPAPKPAAPAREPAASVRRPSAAKAPPPPVERTRPHMETGPIDQDTRIGLFVTLGLALVVGIVVIVVWRKRAAENRRIEGINQTVEALVSQLGKMDMKDPAEAERIIKLAGDQETVWRDHALAAEITSLVARAKIGLSSAKEERQTLATFTDLEKELEKGDVPVARLRDLRRQLDESEAKLATGGPELLARLAIARKKADENYAIRLLDEAKATATATEGSTRPGLIRYQTVEDELKGLVDRAYFQKNEELKAFYTPLYKRALEEGDVLATALFSAEGDKLAWTDCLASPQTGYWNPSSAKGFSHKADNGSLMLVGPDADANQQAVISIGDREQWRHFQLDVAFTIDKGNLEFAFRLGKGVNANTLSYPLFTSGQSPSVQLLKPGKNYSARFSVIGSRLDVRYAGEDIDTPRPFESVVPWTMGRKGAIGIIVSPEARARFTKFQVRELR
jgi:hypothetical protein